MDPRVADITRAFLTVLTLAIVARSLMSWFPVDPNNPFAQLIHRITEPILGPLRRVVPRVGMIDLTPMAAIIILIVLAQLVTQASES